MKTFCAAMLFVLSAFFGTPHSSSAQVRSIQSFVEFKDDWKSLIGTSWQLEGRFGLFGKQFGNELLRFANCDMSFRFAKELTRPIGEIKNLEVGGTIEKDSRGQPYFLVTSIRKTPSDQERFTTERVRANNDTVEMYKIADWATARANFYNDMQLLKDAQDLKKSALLLEFRELDSINPKQLNKFLAKAKELGLEKRLTEDFLHRGYWDQFTHIKKTATQPNAYSDLLLSISQSIPGATQPLPGYSKDREEAYRENAFGVFESADESSRQELGRYFYLMVKLTAIELAVNPDGSNGYAIARQLRDEASERTDLIDKYETMELKYAADRLESMTRAEMLNLSGRYLDRGADEQAREVKRKWLLARESVAREGGFSDLADYADEWVQLLDEKETAAKYYKQAWTLNPQYPLANDWLEKNGYAYHEGNWIKQELLPPTIESQLEIAIREGRPEKGMTPAQVQAAMGIEPDAIVRIANRNQVSELWTYKAAGIMIRFSWRQGDDTSTVKSINSMVSRNLK